jgi:hypothetical protein
LGQGPFGSWLSDHAETLEIQAAKNSNKQKGKIAMKTKTMEFATMMAMTASLLACSSCSSTPEEKTEAKYSAVEDSPTLTETGRGGVVLEAAEVVFTVESVNATDRTVKLRRSDGKVRTIECDPEVRNFDKIQVGDRVTATVAESLALALMKGDDVPVGASTTTAIVRSSPGAKPGGKIVDTVGFTAKVLSVDVTTRLVTLETADGDNETVKVGPDIDLANISAGDHVGVRATRALAISVKEEKK